MNMVPRVLLTTFAIVWMLDGRKPAWIQEAKRKKEESAMEKKLKKSLNVNRCNTYRSADLTVDNNKSLSRNNSSEERAENDVFPSVTAHRWQNDKNVTVGVLNVNFLRNKQGKPLALCLCD